jgi:hypothetical protein
MISKKGFTLIELTIYLAIAIIFLLGTTDFILSINSLRHRGFMISEVETQGLRAMDVMTKIIRNGKGLNSPSWSGDTLSIVSDNILKNPIIIRARNGRLEIVEGDNQAYALHNDSVVVENVYFTNLSRTGTKGLVRIEFDMRFKTDSQNPKLNYKKTFYDSASIR